MTENTKLIQFFELLELNGVEGVRLAREFVEEAGFSLATDLDDIKSWLAKRSEEGDYRAQHAIAQFYLRGAFGYMDRESAYRWCVRSAEQNYGPSVFLLAGMREEDQGEVRADHAEALRLTHKAIALSYGPAARLMGLQYLAGSVVPRNIDLAREYFLRGSKLGDSESMFHLALMLNKDGDSEDRVKAIELLEQAANGNNPSALRALASMYRHGRDGCAFNEEKARIYEARADIIELPYGYQIDTADFLRPRTSQDK